MFGTTAAVIEKKWSGAHANGGLKREKANRPITTNCEKNRSLRCSTRMLLKGVVFLLKRKRAIPFPRDLLHFVRLRSQPRSHGPHQFIQSQFVHKKKQRIVHGQGAFNITATAPLFSALNLPAFS